LLILRLLSEAEIIMTSSN